MNIATTQKIKNEFIRLCEESYYLDLQTDNAQDLERIFIDILKLVKTYPYQRDLFVELFIEAIDNDILSSDYMVPFCMRELRFSEIRDKVMIKFNRDQQDSGFLRIINYLDDILGAFDDKVWKFADLWPYYAYELENQDIPATEQDKNSGDEKVS
jgi:hypothetical protein